MATLAVQKKIYSSIQRFTPEDATLVKETLRTAATLLQQGKFHTLPERCDIAARIAKASALSLFNAPIYLTRGIGKWAILSIQFDFKNGIIELGDNLLSFGDSLRLSVFGTLLISGVFLFPEKTVNLLSNFKKPYEDIEQHIDKLQSKVTRLEHMNAEIEHEIVDLSQKIKKTNHKSRKVDQLKAALAAKKQEIKNVDREIKTELRILRYQRATAGPLKPKPANSAG